MIMIKILTPLACRLLKNIELVNEDNGQRFTPLYYHIFCIML